MYKKVVLALLIFGISALAGYAYFTCENTLELPDATISFTVSKIDRIVLSLYRLNMDPLTLFTNPSISYEDLRLKAGQRVLYKTFRVSENWQSFSTKFSNVGLYLAILTNIDQSIVYDTTVLNITDIGIIFLTDEEKTIVSTVKTTTGIAPYAELFLIKDRKVILVSKTDENGLAQFTRDFDMIVAKKGSSYTVSKVYRPYKTLNLNKKLFLVTDRPIYKPKDVVNFKGQLLKREDGIYTALGATKVRVSILDPKGNEIYNESLTTDELGGFWDSFRLAETAAIGIYQIHVIHENNTFFESFLVEEYRKPEYKVEIETSKEEYISGEIIQALVKVKYFNELPVAAANVAFYVNARSDLTGESFLAFRGYEITGENGELRISVKTEEGFEGTYSIQVIVTDESQRQIEQEKSVYVYADDVKITFYQDMISAKPGEKLPIKVKVTDLFDRPLSGEMTVRIGKETLRINVVDGEGLIEFQPREIGMYKIELRFQRAKKYLYLYSYSWVQGYTVSEFAIIVDKKNYRVDEEVSVEIFSPTKMAGIIALVGDWVYDVQAVTVEGHSTLKISIPKTATERNLFLVFGGYANGKRISDTKKIEIVRQFNVQKLQIHFDKDVYQPKEEARLIIESDEDFSFSLALVDEAIYSMLGTNPISVEDVIYPYNEYPNAKLNFATFWFYLVDRFRSLFAQLPQEKSFEDFKRTLVEAKINVREYFPDTALWVPNLKTVGGRATVIFKVPDSLTTFIATAYGFSEKNIAQAHGKFVVTRDFYVRPILPTFFREGDIVQISANVFNQTSETLKTNLWLELPGSIELIPTQPLQIDSFSPIPLQEGTRFEFYLQPKSTSISYWTVRASVESDPSTITTLATASFGFTDAVALNVPVKPFAFEREFYMLEFLNGLKIFNLPDGEYKQARATIYSSIIPLVENSIRKLIKYPYGCTEQTMSSFLPAVVAAQMGLKIDNLDEIVQKGLMRLYKYQHYDGGWGWWQNDESSDFMTCYVMEGLYHARKAGFDVADSVIKAGLRYLRENLSAYGSYVLDLYGIKHESYQAKSDVDWVYLSLLSEEASERALATVKQEGTFAFVDVQQDDFFTSSVQLTSILLRSLNKWGKSKDLQSKMINYLMSKKDGYFWYSTKDTSFAILALLEVLPQVSKPHVVVKNNERTIELAGEGQIEINQGNLAIEGIGLTEVHIIYYEKPVSAVNEGLSIKRKFYKRYEIPVMNQKAVIDAFVPISQHYIPLSFKLLDEYQDDELHILSHESGDYTYRDTELKVEYFKLTMNNIIYEFEYIQTLNGLILIKLKNKSFMIYDTSLKTAKVYFDILDGALMQKGFVYLKEGKLWMNDQALIDVPSDVVALSCSKSEILLRAFDRTYWFKEGGFVELPFLAKCILYWDGEKVIAKGGFRFSGNDDVTTDELCEVILKEETWPISIDLGDIAKTVITLEAGQGDYLVVEDYFPSCAQILDRYKEKRLFSYSKFDYMWYQPWDRWYTAREVHQDRVVFFALNYSSKTLSYVWRATANGRYQVLPARVYSMYYKGLYGHSNPDKLDIGVWFEVEKSK